MRKANKWCMYLLLLLLLLMPGCLQEEAAPPREARHLPEAVDIQVGVDMCAQCGMKITDPRFAGEIIFETQVRKFDDVGCMFLYYQNLDAAAKEKIVAMYVQDHGGRGWINAEDAYYAYSQEVYTPMGYGIFAFALREDASFFAELHGNGDVKTFTEALEFR
jgi:copper chaperone NosL